MTKKNSSYLSDVCSDEGAVVMAGGRRGYGDDGRRVDWGPGRGQVRGAGRVHEGRGWRSLGGGRPRGPGGHGGGGRRVTPRLPGQASSSVCKRQGVESESRVKGTTVCIYSFYCMTNLNYNLHSFMANSEYIRLHSNIMLM